MHLTMTPSRLLGGMLLLVAGVLVGCRPEIPVTFESNLVHAHKYAITKGLPMEQVVADTSWAVDRLFGTPDDPKVPECATADGEVSGLISLDRLRMAAGPAELDDPVNPDFGDDQRGLFRKHCVLCHGISGQGRGPGALAMPYARDYRMGVFKYKSTARGSKPQREDLTRLIRHGIGGTAMNPIPGLTDGQIEALVDYVIYLSWRGEVERRMIDAAMFDLDLAGGERIIDPATETSDPEAFKENWGYITETVLEVAGNWLDAADAATEIEEPGEIPVPNSRAEYLAMSQGEQAETLSRSVARGKELFLSEAVGCAKCHGKEGKGDGQTSDYDDWTKDWTTNVGLDPKETVKLTPLMARGALPPQNIVPRNFAEGIFRGGSDRESLFRRIANGIAGTPMPAATMIEGQFERRDIWHLVNYVRSLDTTQPAPAAAEVADLGPRTGTSNPPAASVP